jgi:hypothetical protein
LGFDFELYKNGEENLSSSDQRQIYEMDDLMRKAERAPGNRQK